LNRLRICYIVPGFCADASDWCIPVLTNFIARAARAHDAVVYSPQYPYHRASYELFGATVHCLSDGKKGRLGRLLVWRELFGRVADDHARHPFALVHAFWANETGYLGTAIARRLGIPSLVSIGGGELARVPRAGYGSQLHAAQRFLIRRSFERATLITAGSAWVAAKMPARFCDRLRVVPLGADTVMFAPGGLRRGSRLLAAASMIALKDYPAILRGVAAARCMEPSVTLTIAGDGVERPAIERLIRDLGLRDVVRLLGHVPHDAMPELFRASDLFLHGSLYESQGMVVLEALATGMPVIASDVGVAAELPEHLVYRFRPGDADGLARAILRSLDGPEHARRAFQEGPGFVEARYSLAGQMPAFGDLYRELTGNDVPGLQPGAPVDRRLEWHERY